MPLHDMHILPSNYNATIPIWNSNYSWTNKPYCKYYANAKMHEHSKNKIFLYFWNKWYVNAIKDSTTPRTYRNNQNAAKKDNEIKDM